MVTWFKEWFSSFYQAAKHGNQGCCKDTNRHCQQSHAASIYTKFDIPEL